MTASAKPASDVSWWNHAVREAYDPSPGCPVPAPGEVDELRAPIAEVEAQLRSAGVDLGELHALAAATFDQAQARFGGLSARGPDAAGAAGAPAGEAEEADPETHEAWVAPVLPLGPPVVDPSTRTVRRRSAATWLAYAAAAAAATSGGAYFLATQPPKDDPKKEPPVVTKPDAPPAVTSAAPLAPPPAPPPPASRGDEKTRKGR